MAAPTLRTAFQRTLIAGAGLTLTYQTYQHYTTTPLNLTRQVHAEQPPSDTQAALQKLAWSGFTTLTLQSSEMVNHNVKRLTFSLPTSDTITGLSPITSLLTQHTPEGSFIPVFRPYTPISPSTQPGTITFLIKHYPSGKGSSKMHSLVPGDTMKFKPLHEFAYEPNTYDSMLLIAGGSGITPIYQLTNAILSNPTDRTRIALVYANNSEKDILLRGEFEELARRYPDRLRTVFTVSRKEEGGSDESVQKGYVTKELIGKVWGEEGRKVKVLVSGPPAMTEAVAGKKGGFGWTQGSVGGILKELGYESGDVHKF